MRRRGNVLAGGAYISARHITLARRRGNDIFV